MTALTLCRHTLALALALLLASTGCAHLPDTGVTTLKPENFPALERLVAERSIDPDEYRRRGPFEATVKTDLDVRLTFSHRIKADLYATAAGPRAPLVILVHGYGNTKEHHAYQALHLASWGLNAVAVQLPNKGPWIANGRTLARIVEVVRKRPDLLGAELDATRIVLAGHSFGAASVAVALADRAPAVAGILLDPAYMDRGLPAYLTRIARPVLIIGADEELAAARNRPEFYRHVRSGVGEISIRGAAHEDAEFPVSVQPAVASDARTAEHQLSFTAALTVAALSVAATGGFDYAWMTFGSGEKNGRFFGPRKK